MKAREREKVLKLIGKIAASKAVVAKERDKLRGYFNELEDLCETVDRGVESIESGLRDIRDGVDALSERL